MTPAELARLIDHTLLDPSVSPGEISMFCAEATDLGVGAVCISPSRLPLPAGALDPATAVCTVIGFPTGAHQPSVKASEAARAVDDGADEIDMVIDRGLARAGMWSRVTADVAAVRLAVPAPVVLKVIIESAALETRRNIEAASRAAVEGGADFVKTSSGFDRAGGASTEAVAWIAEAVGGEAGVKASGGIRDAETALAMIDAGATRLGCSATRSILAGL